MGFAKLPSLAIFIGFLPFVQHGFSNPRQEFCSFFPPRKTASILYIDTDAILTPSLTIPFGKEEDNSSPSQRQ